MDNKLKKIEWTPMLHDELLAHMQDKKRRSAYTRVVLENSAEIRKTQHVINEGKTETLTLPSHAGAALFELTLKPHSHLTLFFSDENSSFTIFKIILEEGAQLTSYAGIFGSGNSCFIQDTILAGRESKMTQKTLFFGNKNQIFDMFSSTKLRGQNTQALVESKGVLTDKAHASFDGGIEIEQTGIGSDAHLNEHTLLLSPESRMNAIPGLTIGTNEVTASHSAGVTRVDEEELFYAAARGIDEEEATAIIVDGFMAAPVLETLFEKIVRTEVQQKLQQ